MQTDRPNFEIVTTTAGAISIRDNVTREIMHNPVGPWVEANALYIEQSQLARRLREDLAREFVVFDVGLGAAANALAILHCARSTPGHRPLRIVSFERDLELLEFALVHADQFDHFAGFTPAIRELLDRGSWAGDGIAWELRHGDFTRLVERESARADLVFFDPYSPKKNVEMWSTANFRNVRAACAPEGASLYTYSCSTAVRVALLLAGFYVGNGIASGLKSETTQACTRREDLAAPLGQAWLGRFERSHAQLPPGGRSEDLETIREAVRAHPQFSS